LAGVGLPSPGHTHHRQAIHDWEQLAAIEVLFYTVTALGLVRLVCQPKLMGRAVRNAAKASALLEALCQQQSVRLAEPEHDGWEVFRQLLSGGDHRQPAVHGVG